MDDLPFSISILYPAPTLAVGADVGGPDTVRRIASTSKIGPTTNIGAAPKMIARSADCRTRIRLIKSGRSRTPRDRHPMESYTQT